MRYGNDYRRMEFSPRYDREFGQGGYDRGFRARPHGGAGWEEGWGGARRGRGYGGHPGYGAQGGYGGRGGRWQGRGRGYRDRWMSSDAGMSEPYFDDPWAVQRWAHPDSHPTPGRDMGYGLGYGMGRGQYIYK